MDISDPSQQFCAIINIALYNIVGHAELYHPLSSTDCSVYRYFGKIAFQSWSIFICGAQLDLETVHSLPIFISMYTADSSIPWRIDFSIVYSQTAASLNSNARSLIVPS